MSYQIKNRAIIHEFLDDEAILANLETGVYYSIRGNGIPVWQCVLAGQALDAIIQQVNEAYNRDLSVEVRAFIHRLLEEELIVENSAVEPTSCHPVWPKEWHLLALEKYDEMQNLLALDPIHEVDELGWPKKA